MWPRTQAGGVIHKDKRRKREFALHVSFLKEVLPASLGRPRMLEFGCGPAPGAGVLSDLGDLVVSDIYRDERLRLPDDVAFVLCDIRDTPFEDGQFNVVVCNGVLECIDDVPTAFREIRRIASDDAFFVFGVTTPVYVLLSVPGKLWMKAANLAARIRRALTAAKAPPPDGAAPSGASVGGLLRRFGLGGPGIYHSFLSALRGLRVKRWRQLFRTNGFRVVREEPLLCYGASRWPFIPDNRILARAGVASSRLFILKDGRGEKPPKPPADQTRAVAEPGRLHSDPLE